MKFDGANMETNGHIPRFIFYFVAFIFKVLSFYVDNPSVVAHELFDLTVGYIFRHVQ